MNDALREFHNAGGPEGPQTPWEVFLAAFELIMGGPLPLDGEQVVVTVWRSTVRVPDEEFTRLHRQLVNRYFGVQAVSFGCPIPMGYADAMKHRADLN